MEITYINRNITRWEVYGEKCYRIVREYAETHSPGEKGSE